MLQVVGRLRLARGIGETRIIRWMFVSAMFGWLAATSGCNPRSEKSSHQPIERRRVSGNKFSGADFRRLDLPAVSAVRYQSGREAGMHTMLEIVGGGVAIFDYDGDGWPDLFFPGGGHIDSVARQATGAPSSLVRGGADWNLRDVTRESGAEVTDLYSHGATVADYTHDGFCDLLVYGFQGVRLLRNQGDGTFLDVTVDSGLAGAPWTTAAAWGDLDGDGELDLYLGSYLRWDFDLHQVCPTPEGLPDVCSPTVFQGGVDSFFRGTSEGRFVEASESLRGDRAGKALGVLVARMDEGSGLSILVANDLTPNYYWQLAEDGQLEERGSVAGIAVDDSGSMNGSMGITLLDANQNQRFDFLVTNFEHEQIGLYENLGNHVFRHAGRKFGLHRLAARVVGFGVVAADWDGDGDEDVLLTSGHVQYHTPQGTARQPPVLLENDNGRLVRRIPEDEYFHQLHMGRGMAVGDLDNDGFLDIVITHLEDPPVVIQTTPTQTRNWLRVRLVGTESGRTPIGAVVKVTAGERTMVRQLYGGGSYLSQSQPELFFHWPQWKSVDVQVEWPSGKKSTFAGVEPGRRMTVVEP